MRIPLFRVAVTIIIALATVATIASPQAVTQPAVTAKSQFFSPAQWEAQQAFETLLNAVPQSQQLRTWHDMLASEPHVAGTEGDARVIAAIERSFKEMGCDDVQVHEFWGLLAEPVDAKLEIVSEHASADANPGISATGATAQQPTRRGVTALPISEDNLLNDPYVVHPGLNFGWNAYSGSGDVTAGVVYANFGTKEDFETLKKLGIDCTGKIVLARYGGNFRGYKAKYAEAAGAVGLIIYTDPDDSGYRKGVTYPEGGWANDTCIQRGSIVSLDQPGDPLTPGTPATQDAQRLNVENVNLPKIPVQPIGYRAGAAIMTKMTGRPLPENLIKDWQGGLPCAYRLTGGEELKLRLMVQQNRVIKRSANVIATVEGRSSERIYIGSHHDAWGFGAGDPTSGTILVMEAARSFAALAKQGVRPQRTLVFCCWGAEEFSLVGSTEYCEQYGDEIREHAMAYINLDGATMGPNFSASTDPLLKAVIEEAAKAVPQARQADKTVFDVWKGEKPAPTFGNLGGGSDHVGFYCHLGVPSCFLSSQGAPGTAYHSNYDNLAWYRQTVGEDYEPALMLTRLVNVLAARLANAEIPALDVSRCADDLREHVKLLDDRAKAKATALNSKPLNEAIDQLAASIARVKSAIDRANSADDERAATARMNIAASQKAQPWASAWTPRWPGGMSGREWFRNFYASSDPDSGYASWMLPALREPIERGDAVAAEIAMGQYVEMVNRLSLNTEVVATESGLAVESAPATGSAKP